MRTKLLLPALLLVAAGASIGGQAREARGAGAEPPADGEVLTGIDVLQENGFREIKGRRIGLITNQTGIDRKGRSTVHILANAPGVELKALFSPEHGLAGFEEAEEVGSGSYQLPTGEQIPLYSLYGATRTPTGAMLKGLDSLVFDIQDIGARFFTYATTMAMAMESATAEGIDFVVLDRPNPINGSSVEGAVLEPDIRHFIAYFPIPVRHGLTLGEIARLHNFHTRLGARLQVVPLKGWKRAMWYDETGLPWTRPSPNMPDLDAATLYPGIACFEATNVSVGRGTELPFRWIGAPWMKAQPLVRRMRAAGLKGVRFTAKRFTPSKSVFKGESSDGILMSVTDRDAVRPLRIFAHLVTAMRALHPREFVVDMKRMPRFTGTRSFNRLYESGAAPQDIIAVFDADARRFQAQRAPFLLY
ncbi:MAG: DUF1343 domain-containing protein [Elusimicrobiota bacterium]